jgi:NADH-quinone oxidoreductase subunit N
VSLVYYGRIVKSMYFDAPAKEDYIRPSPSITTSIVLTTAALIVIFFAAQIVLTAANPSASSLLSYLLGK